jgi:hypothetical protein
MSSLKEDSVISDSELHASGHLDDRLCECIKLSNNISCLTSQKVRVSGSSVSSSLH